VRSGVHFLVDASLVLRVISFRMAGLERGIELGMRGRGKPASVMCVQALLVDVMIRRMRAAGVVRCLML